MVTIAGWGVLLTTTPLAFLKVGSCKARRRATSWSWQSLGVLSCFGVPRAYRGFGFWGLLGFRDLDLGFGVYSVWGLGFWPRGLGVLGVWVGGGSSIWLWAIRPLGYLNLPLIGS